MSNYRAPLRQVKTDFRSGVIDQAFAMRVDSKALGTGARVLDNVLIRSTGGADRRPGTFLVGALPGSGVLNITRLEAFEFDANEKYGVAFQHGYAHFFDQSGTIVYSVPGCPWNYINMWEMNFVQRGDVMILVHPDWQPRRLRRTSLNSFVLEVLEFGSDVGVNVINQPQARYFPQGVSLKVSDPDTGSGRTLTSNVGIFTSAWIGERVRIWNCEMIITAVASSTTATVTVKQRIEERLGIAPFYIRQGTSNIIVTHAAHGLSGTGTITISGAVDAFGVTAAQLNGSHSVTVRDSDHYVFSAGTPTGTGDGGGGNVRVAPESTSDTTRWTEQMWSARRGWPGAIALYENRLWLGGSLGSPTFLAGSAVGDYYDFNVRDGLDDESVQGTINATSRIVHLVSGRNLQIFCENSESVVDTRPGEPITPASLRVVNQTSYGASPTVRPQLFDGATLFAQANGKNVREFIYDYNQDAHVASPVSVVASPLINTPRALSVLFGTTSRPEQYAFFVNSDGTVAVFHSIRSEELAAWTRFTAGGGGLFKAVCTFGRTVFFSVLRNGVEYLERFELDRTDWWLDGARRCVQSAPGDPTVVPGPMYNGLGVSVMENGWNLGVWMVDAGGTLTLDHAVTDVIVGWDPGVRMEPYPPDREMNDGPMTGEKRRVVSSTVHFHESVSAAVNGEEALGFNMGDDPSLPPARRTGKRRVHHLGYDRDPTVTITQPNPGPLAVLGMVQEVSI